nr:MAG TPA: hypothetical protein [Caudoviricetes sp.]
MPKKSFSYQSETRRCFHTAVSFFSATSSDSICR